jgi:V/A-type H+-transporting ATPase subunit C
MGDVRRFAAIHTKIKAMEGLLLEEDAYKALVTFAEPEEIVSYLKETPGYRDVLEETGLDLDINMIERQLKADLIEKYERLGHYFTDGYKKYYKTLFMRFEVEDIKLFLRTYLRKEDVGFLRAHIHQSKYHRLDLKSLTNASSLEVFVDGLKGTKYHDLLKYYLNEDPEKMMFYMEMRLDHYYFKSLSKQLSEFSNEDKSLMKEVIGKNVDVQNLQWIYRGLKYYKLSSEELLNYTLNIGFYLKYKELKDLCYTRDIEVLVQKIKETKYGFLFTGSGHSEIFFELNMERYLLKLMEGLQRNAPMTFLDTIVYMHRKEYEVRDIFTLLEAKRYHAPIEDVKTFLVHSVD